MTQQQYTAILDRGIPPVLGSGKSISLIPPSSQLLPNGVELQTVRTGNQEVIRLDVTFEAGRLVEPQRLVAGMTCKMIQEGSLKYSSAEIAEMLDTYGAFMSVNANMYTTDFTLFSLTKHAPRLIQLLYELITTPTFPKHELEQKVSQDKHEWLVSMEKVTYLASRERSKAIYGPNHPLGELLQESDYGKLNVEILRDFYNQYYVADKCWLLLTGQYNNTIIDTLAGTFGSIDFGIRTSHEKKVFSSYPMNPCSDKQILVARPDAQQCAVNFVAPAITMYHPDIHGVQMLMTLLGGYFGSRLMSQIREKEGLTYGIGASISGSPLGGIYIISAQTDTKHVQQLITSVYKELQKLQDELVSDEEMERLRNYMIGENSRKVEGLLGISSYWLTLHEYNLPSGELDKIARVTQEMTPQEMQRLAKRYLRLDDIKVIVVGNIETEKA
ncbi:MAG TPA: pitrilysin family protein [Bacteroidaceae bacterium]|nr:pitrilysin family protein [Bacteroidaceae bacterium]